MTVDELGIVKAVIANLMQMLNVEPLDNEIESFLRDQIGRLRELSTQPPQNRLTLIGTTFGELTGFPQVAQTGIMLALAKGEIDPARAFLTAARGQLMIKSGKEAA